MTHRWARRSRRALAGALTTALALSVVGTGQAAPAAAADFQSSFEAGEPQPSWTDTVETDAAGKPKSGGVNGNDGISIPGNVTDKVTDVRASAENTGGGELKENLIDGNTSSKWLAFANTGWLEFTLSEPIAITSYAVSSANDAPERDPKNWKLQGSQDGKAWSDVDVRSGQSFAKRFETKKFELTNTVAHKHLRFEITANNGGAATQFSEIQFAVKASSEPAPNMRSRVGKGPNGGYAAKSNAGYTGTKALQFLGEHVAKDRGYSYNKVFDVDVAVKPDTELSYLVFPQFIPDDLKYPSTHASVDLAFSDGSYLSELGAKDQYGFELSPKGQGASKSLYTNQWNKLRSKIGTVAAGKTIKRVLVAYDNPSGPGNFAGWFDDFRIGAEVKKAYATPADYALTTRGTQSTGGFSRGNNFPATAVPHGFNFWTPMTNAGSISWLYDYHKANNAQNLPTLQAFTTSHEPSPWMGDRQTFQVFPQSGAPNIDRVARALPFKHENEIAKPHYYGVTFENGMRTEIAPTDHAALFRFTFTGNDSNLLFDNANNNGGLTLDIAKGVVSGYSDVKSGLSTGATRLFVYATFDRPVSGGGKLTGAGRDNVTGYLKFDTSSAKTVTMRIATSLIGVEQAKKNLELEATGSFESVRDRAQQAWNEKLKVIEVEGASEDQLVTLYSNLYRLFLYPNSGHENVGTATAPVYKHASPVAPAAGQDTATQTGAKIVDGKVYVNNGFWDTYRTTWPAYTLLTPEKAGEMVEGFVQQYKEGGWVSRWSSPGYANLMTGTSSDVSFSDAFLKGVTNFDVQAAYDAAVKNATVTPPNANVGRKGLDKSIFLGYTPTTTGEGMSWAIEGYVNDFGIATMAKALHDKAAPNDPRRKEYAENHEYFLNRAQNYVNMFDKSVGFFQGRTEDGKWRVTPDKYEPREWGHDYTETNAWNMAFTVPHDGQGLANLYGGRAGLGKKLDQFFSTPETAGFPGSYGGVIHEMLEARDVRMGQYGHSNQPSHHIPYMYNYAGQPSKTQEKVREILSRLYVGSEIGQGYAGDEDNGELSAWYIFSALGFYPLQMGKPDYAVGSPLFTKATVNLGGGKKLVVSAPKNSAKNIYVQGLKVNGQKWDKTFLPHDVLARGGTLEFDMGATPSAWGTGENSVPESITKGSEVPRPLRDTPGTASSAPLADNTSQTQAVVDSVQLQASTAERVEFYTLTSGKDGADPKSWKVKGSYDGKTWTTVDERDGQSFSSRQQTKAFKLAKPGHYTWYRVEFGGKVTLSEVEFLSKPRAECTTTITGERSGPQTLSGVVCLKDATITGPVTIAAGASVHASGGRIIGPVRATGAVDVVLLGTHVTGPVDISGSTGVVGVETARVTGPLSLVNNTGSAAVAASTVVGPVTCSGNTTAPSNNGLPVGGTGPRSGQCTGL
ncbi:GH92 family glycosyl hydrolase [Allokutzneria multivorans]|uniref:GH92 family glycosyl hydrolase n=1 Tax=Allokutzneria multivorans TaxID=1142134 RepID=A0ABP7U5G6_9PSEU